MSRSDNPYDLLVIGGGLAGLTAAHRAALRGFSVASLDEGGHMGGLVMNVSRIDHFPSLEPVSGIDLAAARLEAILDLGADIIPAGATGMALDGDIKTVSTDSGDLKARVVVVAAGARLKSLGVPGEAALSGRGVSQCADCDAGFFAGQDVVVIGGGDAALQEALHLRGTVRTVTLVTRGNALRAKRRYVDQASADPKFTFLTSSTILEILGRDGVEGVRLAPEVGGDPEVLACSGVFVFVGLEPNAGFLPSAIERDADGYVVTDAAYRTSLPGVYAIGAVRAGYSGQLIDAVEEAAAAVTALPGR